MKTGAVWVATLLLMGCAGSTTTSDGGAGRNDARRNDAGHNDAARNDAGHNDAACDAGDAGERVGDVCHYEGKYADTDPAPHHQEYPYVYSCAGYMSDPDCIEESFSESCQCIYYDCKTPP